MLLSAAVLFAPLVVLEIAFWQPFVASTFASTSAIALHRPSQFQRDWVRILRCYALAFLSSVPLSLSGVALDLPTVLPAAVAALLILTSRRGRFHPPVACVPFAVTTVPSTPSLINDVAVDWLVVVGATGYLLLVLAALTRVTTPRSHSVGPVDQQVEQS
nr:hypothetical protein GCM10017611_04820 [Rhodococcus wratislaviensis]